jgi:two-component system, cell cycle sensor histidine kinase and response regulator CckA
MAHAMHPGPLFSALIERMKLAAVIWYIPETDAAELTLVAGNPAARAVSGLDYQALQGSKLGQRCPEALAQGRHLAYAEVLSRAVELSLPPAVYPELGARVVSGSIVPLPERCVAVLFEDATEREQAAEAARKLNAFLDSILENIPTKVFVKDAQHLRYELYNRAGEMLSGWSRSQVLGQDDQSLYPKEQADFFQAKDREVLRSGRMLDIPEEPIDTAYGRRWLNTKKIPIFKPDGQPSHLVGISVDITERKLAVEALQRAREDLETRVEERTHELVAMNEQLVREMNERQRAQKALEQTEEQLRHSQKMEAIGRLAGGVAHDFNNLLSVILSYANVLSGRVDADSSVAEGLSQIRKASERAADLTRQLLAFSRQQVLAPRVVDLNAIIDGMSRMLGRVIGEDIELELLQAAELGHIRADPGQLEQVIMNLVVNARDAMPSGGRLTLETTNVEIDDAYAREHVGVTAGPYVMLAVTDNGIGMDKATLGRIFEPFFTTKRLGKGTGLGLSTVFGIVKQSGGHISAVSEPEQGTTFRIYLARTEAPLSVLAPPPSPIPARGGTETLLLVEDEEQVRVVACEILKDEGYRVLEAASPTEALTVAAAFSGPIDLLVTDVILPEMNGRVLSERLRRARPTLEVLFMSGYTDKALDPDGVLAPGSAFLQKPITPQALTSAVRRLLDSGPETRSESA